MSLFTKTSAQNSKRKYSFIGFSKSQFTLDDRACDKPMEKT